MIDLVRGDAAPIWGKAWVRNLRRRCDRTARGHARGSVPLQLVQLGVMLSFAALAFNTLLGACSGQVGRWLQRRPGAEKFQRGLLALVMVGLAVRLLLLDRPSAPLSTLPARGT